MAPNLELTAKENISEKLYKLEQQNQRLIEQNRQLAKVTHEGMGQANASIDGLSTSLENGAASVARMATSFIGLGGVIETVKAATEDWARNLEKVAEAQQRTFAGLAALAGRSGDLKNLPAIEDWAYKVPGLTSGQALDLFGGITGAAPGAGLGRRQGMVESAADIFPLINSDLSGFGRLTGKVGAAMPQLAPGQAVGVALKMRQLAGEHAEDLASDRSRRVLGSLMAAGMAQEEAIATMIVGYEGGQTRAGAVMKAAEEIDKDLKPVRPHGRPLSAEEKAKNRFATADRSERWNLLKTDKEVRQAVMGSEALLFSQISPEEIKRVAGELRTAEGADYLKDTARTMAASHAIGELQYSQRQSTQKEVAEGFGDRATAERLRKQEEAFEANELVAQITWSGSLRGPLGRSRNGWSPATPPPYTVNTFTRRARNSARIVKDFRARLRIATSNSLRIRPSTRGDPPMHLSGSTAK